MKKIIFQLFRYGLTMVVSQIIIIVALYLAVDLLQFNEKVSYAVVLTCIYVGVYFSYLRFVFKKNHSQKTLFRFGQILIFSWIANNLLFALLVDNLNLHYTIASLMNTIILGGIRFALNKYYVFK